MREQIVEQLKRDLMAARSIPHEDAGLWQMGLAMAALALVGSVFFPDYSDETHPKFISGAATVVALICGWKWFDVSDRQKRKYKRQFELEDRLKAYGYRLDFEGVLVPLESQPT